METLIGIIIAVVIAIGAYLFGRGSNGRRSGGVRGNLDRAGDSAGRAGNGVRIAKDAVSRSVTRNNRAKKILERGRAILKRARERADKKNDGLGGG